MVKNFIKMASSNGESSEIPTEVSEGAVKYSNQLIATADKLELKADSAMEERYLAVTAELEEISASDRILCRATMVSIPGLADSLSAFVKVYEGSAKCITTKKDKKAAKAEKASAKSSGSSVPVIMDLTQGEEGNRDMSEAEERRVRDMDSLGAKDGKDRAARGGEGSLVGMVGEGTENIRMGLQFNYTGDNDVVQYRKMVFNGVVSLDGT
ncbi:hypothetical protein B484DRAFT_405379 [Ochromonadaceae sp. CCMP2298]|nr:hypothetical protein B484DRAFT_405379 [Ochromonadaceae sp. CCMP2298]